MDAPGEQDWAGPAREEGGDPGAARSTKAASATRENQRKAQGGAGGRARLRGRGWREAQQPRRAEGGAGVGLAEPGAAEWPPALAHSQAMQEDLLRGGEALGSHSKATPAVPPEALNSPSLQSSRVLCQRQLRLASREPALR